MAKYILVQWPDSQYLMEHRRFDECIFAHDLEGHVEVGSSAFMCPEDLYGEIFNDMQVSSEENNRVLREAVIYKYYSQLQEMFNDLATKCSGGEEITLNFVSGKIKLSLK